MGVRFFAGATSLSAGSRRIPLFDGEKQQKPLIPALRKRNTIL
jgi:hypothetical protein